ncbi:MAG: DUF4445 domain-containing protein [Oscillospiraceae bacterium]|nr:DUF4445 domain-containing protein [Oscillospiraceae bacterium]
MSLKVTVHNGDEITALNAQNGQLLSDVLKLGGMVAVFPCGGNGKCGRCKVMAEGSLEAPGAAEQQALGEEINNGIRLACMTRVLGDCSVSLPRGKIEAVTKGVISDYVREPLYANCGAAIDIGTTTIAAQLWQDGKVAAEYSMLNPQATFGADVISRIQAALDGRLPELQKSVAQAIKETVLAMGEKVGMLPETVVITGNTAMLHFLASEDPAPLSAAPFHANRLFGEWVSAADIGITDDRLNCRFYLTPCFSAFVGGDISTAVLASDMLKKDEISLLVDIGTNGEMALLKDGRLLCCSTAAGPVFEGAQISCGMQGKPGAIDHVDIADGAMRYTTIGGEKPIGLCGSGLVDCIAALIELEQLDETGFLEDDVELAPGVVLTPQDIRMVQLAKGAICAGITTLCDTAGISLQEVSTLYIAGGFGAKLDIESAAAIGMIPAELAPKAKVIGNAALAGASMLLESAPLLDYCRTFIGESEMLELSANPLFAQNYMEAMMF